MKIVLRNFEVFLKPSWGFVPEPEKCAQEPNVTIFSAAICWSIGISLCSYVTANKCWFSRKNYQFDSEKIRHSRTNSGIKTLQSTWMFSKHDICFLWEKIKWKSSNSIAQYSLKVLNMYHFSRGLLPPPPLHARPWDQDSYLYYI